MEHLVGLLQQVKPFEVLLVSSSLQTQVSHSSHRLVTATVIFRYIFTLNTRCRCIIGKRDWSRHCRTCFTTAAIEIFVTCPGNHLLSFVKKKEAEYNGKSTIIPPSLIPQFVDDTSDKKGRWLSKYRQENKLLLHALRSC